MPVIWKKAKKIGRISRLISDFRSKRRQSSLPLQTGFPTSLADLFIKNKDRLKKSPKTHSEKPPPSPPSSEIISETHSPINPSPTHEKIPSESISEHASDVDNLERKSEEDSEERLSSVSKNVSDVDLEDPISPPNPKRTLSVGSMVFLVLGLALGTKKVALVVTLSFLAISLLQFARKRVAFFSQHCEDANKRFGSVIGAYVSEPREGEPSMIKKSQVTNSSTRSLTRSYQIGYMEDDFVEVENLNIHKEGSGKLKSNVSKKLKPKKGKGMKCGRVGKDEEASFCLSRESSDSIEQIVPKKQEEEEKEEKDEDCVLLEDDSSCSIGGNACSRTRMINWPNFVLIVLILSGLVAGRLLALVLTILWCLLVKSSETLWQKLKMYRINSSLL